MSDPISLRRTDPQEGGPISVAFAIACGLLGLGLALLLASRPLPAAGLTLAGWMVLYVARHPLAGLVAILSIVALLGSDSILKIQAGIEWVEVDLILAVAALGWIARGVVTGFGRAISRLDLAVILFGVIILLGVHRGLSNGIALADLRSELRPPAYLILVYAISRSCLDEVGKVRRVFQILLVLSTLAAVKALAVYFTVPLAAPGSEEQIIWATRVMNSDGFKRVIVQGAETFPVLMGLFLFPTFVGSHSIRRRLLGWTLISLFVLVIVVSMTRSYWIGFLAGLVCLILVERPNITFRMMAEMALVGCLLLGGLSAVSNLIAGRSVFDLTELIRLRSSGAAAIEWDASAAARLAELQSIASALSENLWAGTGLGGTYLYYSGLGGGLAEWEYTHNSYAYWALKLGLPGLVVVLTLLTLGLLGSIRWLTSARTEGERSLATGLLAGVVALCVISLTAPWLTHYVGAAWTGLAFGCSETMRLRREREPAEVDR